MLDGVPAPRLSKIRLYPIKSLDPVEVSEARIGPSGGLALDRVWAIYAPDAQWIRSKHTPAMQLIRSRFAPGFRIVDLIPPAGRKDLLPAQLSFPGDTAEAAQWFSSYLGEAVTVRYAEEGFPDDDLAPGPTIVSLASLEAVCTWFPEISLEQARQRFRTNLEISGVPAFWEDRIFSAEESRSSRFRIGEVEFEGRNPCARCVVPSRNPSTGEPIRDFQKRFSELRRAHLPAWSPAARFDHFYRFAVNTRIPASETGKALRPGDGLTLLT
jgi:uncharacterized protein YcbX